MKNNFSYEDLKKKIIDETINSLTKKSKKSTTFERAQLFHEADELYSEFPISIKYGKTYKYVLEKCSLPIDPTDLILGRIPERVLNEEDEYYFQKCLRGDNFGRPKWIVDSGHLSFWWEGLIEHGITGLKARAVAELEKRKKEPDILIERLNLLEGMIDVYDAFLVYLKRYAEAADTEGLHESADTCRELTLHEPQNFRQSIQLLWIVQLVYCAYTAGNPTLSIGRMDILLEKIYEKDRKSGILSEDFAGLLILDFYRKHNLILGRGEHQLSTSKEESYTGWYRNLCYDSPQYMSLCGRRRDGTYLNGELTHLLVDMIEPRFKNPVVTVRYAPDMQKKCPELWKKIVAKARQSTSIMIYNEADVISAYIKSGVDPQDAFDFQHYGCNHPTLPGHEAMTQYGGIIPLPLFLNILKTWVKEGHEPQTTEELYDAICSSVKNKSSEIIENLVHEFAQRMEKPARDLEMVDCFCKYTAPAAASYRNYGSKYICSNIQIGSYASFVDVFCAVDELVIKQKKMTLAHLIEAVNANYEGYAVELALCRGLPKFGSDDPVVNTHAKALMERFIDDVYELSSQKLIVNKEILLKGDYPVVPRPIVRISMETDNGHFAGYSMGATPDGRLAGTPISQNSAPAPGACTNRITARLCSVSSIPFDRIVAGAHNLSIQPNSFKNEEGLDNLATVLGGYFDMGGLQLQVTAIDPNLLREAQKDPDNHRDLMVRITGYSAVFVDMEKHAQDDFLRREAMES